MEKSELFKQLSPEHKAALIGPQLELYTAAVGKKASVSPQLATIAAALIAIFALSSNLITFTRLEAAIILSVLLLLVPISLAMYVWEQQQAAKNALKVISEYQGEDIFRKFNSNYKPHERTFHFLWANKEFFFIFFILTIIAFVIGRLWSW